MKTILVTCANGFVGTHTLKSLMKLDGITLIAACRDKSKLIPEFKGKVREGDFRDENYLDTMLEGVDVDNSRASEILGYHPAQNRRNAVSKQICEMDKIQKQR